MIANYKIMASEVIGQIHFTAEATSPFPTETTNQMLCFERISTYRFPEMGIEWYSTYIT